jgi:hypothetical protein
MRRRVVGSVVVAGMLACMGGAAVAAPVEVDPGWRTPLVMDFEGGLPGAISLLGLANDGDGDADVRFVTLNDPVSSLGSVAGNGYLRLPRFSGTDDGSYAAVRVEAQGSNWLSPGKADFSFGADVRLDALSEGTNIDNGDNVMQVGLYGDAAQYKLQVDGERASCVLRGANGTLVAKADTKLVAKKWYRLQCDRVGDAVVLTQQQLSSAEPAEVATDRGPLGVLETDDAALSIGAKVSPAGKIVGSSTDQFNGRVDNVTYAVAQ